MLGDVFTYNIRFQINAALILTFSCNMTYRNEKKMRRCIVQCWQCLLADCPLSNHNIRYPITMHFLKASFGVSCRYIFRTGVGNSYE
jgi:hypothetical protein